MYFRNRWSENFDLFCSLFWSQDRIKSLPVKDTNKVPNNKLDPDKGITNEATLTLE